MPDPNQIPDEPRAMPPEDQIHDNLICDKCGKRYPVRAGICTCEGRIDRKIEGRVRDG